MSTQGPNFPSTGVDDSGIGTVAWTNPGNVTADDGSSATASLTSTFFNSTTHYVKATGFGFSIPSGATINGITVEWKVSKSGTDTIVDAAARIVKGGTIGSTDKSSATAWGAAAYLSHGGSSDLWGDTWTDTDINASTFGAALAAKATFGMSATTVSIDGCRVTVAYTTSAGIYGRRTLYGRVGSRGVM